MFFYLRPPRPSFAYQKLCRDFLKVGAQLVAIQRNRERGDYPDKVEYLPEAEGAIPKLGSSISVNGEPVSNIMAQYVDEFDKAGNWTPKTTSEIKAILNLFTKAMGDVAILSIDRAMISEYKQKLLKLPPNMSKVKKYRDKTIDEILKMDVDKTMSITTVNKNLGKLSSFFSYAVKNGCMDSNPAEGIQVRQKKRDDEYRDAFDKNDLEELFVSEEYIEDHHKSSYAFWTPILSLYTGCRLEEICQLHLDDIHQDEGLWVLDINDNDEKKVKSPAAKRLVPLHPVIIEDLNFIGHVEALKGRGETRLFPELKKARDGYGQTVSKWFGRYRKRCGVRDDKKTFHSLRHTFITHLKHQKVDPYLLHEIDGHTIESLTMGRYGKRFPSKVLYEDAILKLDYEIDLKHLKDSKYVCKGIG